MQPLNALRRAFDAAVAALPSAPFRSSLELAGRAASFAARDRRLLGDFLRPFRHLEQGGNGVVELELLLEHAVDLPAEARLSAAEAPGGQARVEHSEGGRFVGYRRGETVAALDRAAGRLVVWAGTDFPAIDRGQPLFALFAVWLHDLDLQLVHAGLVARGESGALLGGAGGSGKSTTALACLRAGLAYLGDDSIALSLPAAPGGEPRGFSLYASARLEPANLERFPELAGTAEPLDPREPDKLVLYPLEGRGPRRSGAATRLRAVLLPHVTGGRPRAVPLAPAKALLALAPSSIRAMAPQPMAAGLERLARLVEVVPCYRLEVGEDLVAVAAEVGRLLEEDV